MIGLASGLLAIAGLFAGRAVAIAHADGVATRLGIERHEPPARSPSWSLVWPPMLLIASRGDRAGGRGRWRSRAPRSIRHLVRRRRRTRQRHRAAEQIADAVGALSAGLRAGLSLSQAFAYARDEAEEPLRSELAGIVDRIDTGTPVGEALSGLGGRARLRGRAA